MRAHASIAEETALDGSDSCGAFVTLYCDLKKSLVHKNMPCAKETLKKKAKSSVR
jgi:hypothetical protein